VSAQTLATLSFPPSCTALAAIDRKAIAPRAWLRLCSYLHTIALIPTMRTVPLATYERMLLQENGISPWNQGFAIVNALIFGKVVLIAHALNLGRT
jgi:hypothetical protein